MVLDPSHFDAQLFAEMQVTLGIGPVDFVLGEFFPNREVEIAFHATEVMNIFREEPQFHVQPVIAELCKKNFGGRFVEDFVVFFGDFEQKGFDFFHVAGIVHFDRNVEANLRRFARPVGNFVGDEFCVGHDDKHVVVGADGGAAQANVGDLSRGMIHLDAVAHADRLFGQNNQAADEIFHHVLQAEAQPDAQCADQNRERGQFDADGLKSDEQPQPQHQITRNAREGVLHRRRELGSAQDIFAGEDTREFRQKGDDDDDQEEGKNHYDGNRCLAQCHQRPGKHVPDFGEAHT